MNDRDHERFEIYSDDHQQRMHELFDAARETCPVTRSSAQGGYWLVTGYAAATEVLHDDARFTSTKGKSIPYHQTLLMPPIDSDPPEHRQFRQLLNRFFSRSAVLPYRDMLVSVADEVIDRILPQGRCEFVHDFAGPFTATTLARVALGIADEDGVASGAELVVRVGAENTPEAWGEMRAFVERTINERRANPTDEDDVINAVLHGSLGDRELTEDERVGVIFVLFLGGLDTTKGAMSSIMARVAHHPELVERVRDPDWTRSDLDEFLRIDAPVTALARYATQDTEVAGQTIREGEPLLVAYGAANRDPAVFGCPHELDFERQRNPHMAFGVGIHRCLGSHLARLQIEVAFERLFSRIDEVRPLTPPPRWMTGVARHPVALPIEFVGAGS